MGSTPTGISGSRAAAIIGLSQYATPFTVWQDLMEQRQPGFNAERGLEYIPFQGNPATEFGNAFESSVIKLTENKFKTKITDQERVFVHPDKSFVTCHVDGVTVSKHFEGKTANHRAYGATWGEPGTDRIPTIYQVQNQHCLMCSGLPETLMSVLVFPKTVQDWDSEGWKAHFDTINNVHFLKNHETDQIIMPDKWAQSLFEMGFFHNYHIEAKPDTHKILLELYDEFWRKYVLEGVAPEAVDYSDIRRMFIEPKGVLVVPEKQAEWLREYRSIGKEIGASGFLKKRQMFLKNQILKFALEQTVVADEDAAERVLFMDEAGKKLGGFNGKTFRA